MTWELRLRDLRSVPTRQRVRLIYCGLVTLEKWNLDNLAAPYWRLYWNDRPGATLVSKGKSYPLTPGRLVLIAPGTPFDSRGSKRMGHLHLHFTVEPRHGHAEGGIYSFPVSSDVAGLLRQLTAVLNGPLAKHSWQTAFLGEALICCLLWKLPPESWPDHLEDSRIEQALQRIKRRFPESCSNTELAREARMHPNAFIRLFRTVTGSTPGNYLRNLRIVEACFLLHRSEETIEMISEKTGFCDRFHFSRAFRKSTGMTPAEFRRRNIPQQVVKDVDLRKL